MKVNGMEMSEMTGENDSNIKGSSIMLLKSMKQKRNAVNVSLVGESIRNNRMKNIIRLDIEGHTTENAYTENECMVIIHRLDDSDVSSTDADVRSYFNHSCKPISESNMRETDNEFNRRQYKLLQQLKQIAFKEDKKYANAKK